MLDVRGKHVEFELKFLVVRLAAFSGLTRKKRDCFYIPVLLVLKRLFENRKCSHQKMWLIKAKTSIFCFWFYPRCWVVFVLGLYCCYFCVQNKTFIQWVRWRINLVYFNTFFSSCQWSQTRLRLLVFLVLAQCVYYSVVTCLRWLGSQAHDSETKHVNHWRFLIWGISNIWFLSKNISNSCCVGIDFLAFNVYQLVSEKQCQ